jgi:Zn-dependent M16 (insulinase) family peptidase
LGEVTQHSLFPDNIYRHNSGGDPVDIPDLTYEQFKNFHETYYHPSNAYIFWYGDDPEEARLEKMAGYLEGYSKLSVESAVPLQKPFEETLRLTEPYAASEEEEPKYYVSINWVLDEQDDPEKVLGLGVLNHILVGTPASPLRKALIDSGYGEDLVGGGMNSWLRQLTFSTGLKGVQKENAAKVESLVQETLESLASDGIDPNMLAASMNTIEFQLRENNTGAFPRGIVLMLRALGTWLYDGDPFEPLAFEDSLDAIKQRLETGELYFESLINSALLENTHRSTVILEPDPDLNRRKVEDESARLMAIQDRMSEEEFQKVAERERELIRIQETPDTPEALETLPSLALEDLDKENKIIPLDVLDENGVPVLYHDLFTNGIVYFDLSFDLAGVPQNLLPYLSLFASGLVKMGTETEDFVQLSQRIGRETGGISPTLLVKDKFNADEVVSRLVVRGKSTVDKVEEMLAIMKDILLTTKYDNKDRFRQVLTERKARKEAGLVPGGHRVVAQRLAASQSAAGWLSEQTGGLESLFFARKLLGLIENDWPEVAEKFTQIRDLVVNRRTMMLNVILDQENWDIVRKLLPAFCASIPERDVPIQTWDMTPPDPAEGLTIPAQVNYVGKGANIYKLGYQPDGAINVIRKYLGTTYIWEKIRVQGGAYGGFTTYDLNSGAFNFLSYRDPNLIGTLKNYDGTVDFLRNLDLARSELVKSIIGTIGDMDSYQLPDAKGYASMARYLTGYSDEVRQGIRDQVLNTTVEDFHALADVLEQVNQNGVVAVLGSADSIAEANQEKDGFLTVKTVL